MSQPEKKFRFEKRNVNVRNLIVLLLIMDVAIFTVMLLRKNKPADTQPEDTPEPTAEIAVTPEPTETPETSAEPIVGIRYAKQPYTAEDPSEGFESEWVIISDQSAYADTYNTYDTAVINVGSTGSALSSLSLSRGGIPFQAGVTYTVFLNASSTVNRKIAVTAHNWDSGSTLGSTAIDVTGDSSYHEWTFKASETTYNGGITIDLGNNGVSDSHTVTIQGLRIAGDDSNAAVRTNQIGYYADEQKRCTFIYSAGDLFDVVNKDTGAIAYSGAIVGKAQNMDTGETDYYGDFTNLQEPGTYFIRSQTGVVSHSFTISSDPFKELRRAALRMFSFQRCGMDLTEWADGFAHPACHTGDSNFYLTDTLKDTRGGWHDAGDYGRYTKTGTKAVNDLLLSYLNSPSLFDDANDGPDSGNGVPDILDEARYELEWILKMQEDSGAFFIISSTMSFPDDYCAPEDDHEQLYLLAPDTIATADAVGSLAIAYLAFKDTDADFAQRCLEAAKKGQSYLSSHPDMTYTMNPMGFSTGQYLDDSDTDGRFTAASALYAATNEQEYLDRAKDLFHNNDHVANSVTWNSNGMYGVYLFLASPDAEKKDPEFYAEMVDALDGMADSLISVANNTPYHVAAAIYTWGSNSTIASNGIVLSMAYDFTGKQEYYQTAVEQLNYLLGKNSLDMCFVSGFGTNSPINQHNRLSLSKNGMEIGFLSGGPDSSREDNITQALPADTPAAKVYADDFRSYSTNEIAIYYNSALLYLLTSLV